jgi:hypothetical protein
MKSPQPNINQEAKTMSENIIQLNQEIIHNELRDLVRNSVEETLNAMLDQEADVLINADKYEEVKDVKAIVPVIITGIFTQLQGK